MFCFDTVRSKTVSTILRQLILLLQFGMKKDSMLNVSTAPITAGSQVLTMKVCMYSLSLGS